MLSDKIVVIDDDPKVIESIRMILNEYEIIEFQSGKKAIDFFKNPNDIHLVLLDVYMKNENGLDVLEALKSINKDLNVIMMTAFGSMDIVVQALRFKADDFIEKPFNVAELRGKVKEFLKRKKVQKNVVAGRDYRIDLIKRFVTRNYSNVSLESIAQELCLSEKYISRMFKKKNQGSYREYKLQVKIKNAKAMLMTTSYNVCQISERLGYQNPESFMRIFKKMTNQTPSQYRSNCATPTKNQNPNNEVSTNN